MITRLVRKVRALLGLSDRLTMEIGRLREDVDRDVQRAIKEQGQRLEAAQQRLAARLEAAEERLSARTSNLEREVKHERKELRDRLLQYHLQLGRLTHVLENRTVEPRTYAAAIPLVADAPPVPVAVALPDEWLHLERCPGCGGGARTAVCEWNRLILRPDQSDDSAARYEYVLCHGCGLVYAQRRPVGRRYRSLVDEFPETVERDTASSIGLINPYPLSEADRDDYRRLVKAGVFVSDHAPREHLPGLLPDRFENAAHVEVLGALVPNLAGARVLEVRSRAGAILDGLRRYYAASVVAMPIFESQQLIIRELHGIECSDLIDFDEFTIPYSEPFDVIICNHMLTHVVRPARFFEQIRQHLRPGGYLYLYNEVDEAEFLGTAKSILSPFNPLHLQAFDKRSLARVLSANQFEVVFQTSWRGNQLCMAVLSGHAALSSPGSEELETRIRAYANGRARMILKAPEALRCRFAHVWSEAVAHAVTAGMARFDDEGTLHVVKQ
jgi:SAM-dependent methyltransferase